MAKEKKLRKTLPKELPALMEAAAASGDYSAVHAMLEGCEIDARGGYAKGTALMFRECTPALARWLVGRGLPVDAVNTYGETALHGSVQARFHHSLPPAVLIELGADVRRPDKDGHTPLHRAVDGKNLASVQQLLALGVDLDARDQSGLPPLEYGLQRMSNIDLDPMVPVARALLAAGAPVTERAKGFVRRAAETFEFHRAAFNKDYVDDAAAASAALCQMFGVEPPRPRQMHDGVSPIVASPGAWQDQHDELWQLLVPSSGACATVQGEVVRIAGRVSGELHRNGGANWDGDYDAMLAAFCDHVASGNPLAPAEVSEAKAIAAQVRSRHERSKRLAELSVAWVAHNPTPMALPPPGYKR